MTYVGAEQRFEADLSEGLRGLGIPDWLAAVADPVRAQAALTLRIPEFASGELTLRECEVEQVRMKDDAWTVRYRLAIEGPEDGSERFCQLRGDLVPSSREEPGEVGGGFGTDGWRCYVPELRLDLRLEVQDHDADLPSLSLLTDPIEAGALLERAIRGSSPAYADLRIQSSSPRVMRYKPGSRCTILYRLEFPPGCDARGWPNPVVAKTHWGDKGRNAYEGMRALWDSELGRSRAVRIAEPLAYLPEPRVLVQASIPQERTLKELIRSSFAAATPQAVEELAGYVEKVGVGLAQLHTCSVRSGVVVAWDDDLAEVRGRVRRVAASMPALSDAVTPLLDRLDALAARYPPQPRVPAHRSFRPAQVLLHDGEIGFIDFDGFCQAEPALDLALFRTTLKDFGVRMGPEEGERQLDDDVLQKRLRELDDLCERFLTGYEAIAPVSRERVALWETLDILSAVLNCWLKVKVERLVYRLSLLRHHLRTTDLGL